MRSLLISSAALAALLPAALPAQAWAADATVNEVVVTATRLPTTTDLVTGAHVIDEAELQARQTGFVLDVLQTVPGVGVTQNGAFGGVAAIRIRGASPDKTLVLIDGVPAGDPADPNGAFDASSLQAADVSRIEVLEGPQGSLWGSDAIGGVVAITTRETRGWRASAEGGSFGTARGFLGAGTAQDGYALNGSIAAFHTDGISKADTGTEKDGFDTVTANLGGRVKLSDALQLDGRVRYSDSKVDLDGYPAPDFTLADTADRQKSRAWSGFARASLDAFGLTQQLSWSGYKLTRDTISDFPSRYEATRQVWRWTASRGQASDPFAFTGGLERNATTADLDARASTDLSVNSAFAVARVTPAAPLTLTGSLRWDDPDRFKARGTGRIAAAWAVGAGFTATASAGQGFKIPTISEVVCDFCYAPPVTLRPERAEGYDLRLGWASSDGRISASVDGYRLNVRDQISYVAGRYVNIARTRSKGIDAEADLRLAPAWRLKLAWGWIDAVDAGTGLDLLRVPHDQGAAALFWDQGPWQAALTVRGESSQSDTDRDGFSPIVRKGFVTADLAGSYALSRSFALTARLENLADRRYEETYGFREPGRAIYVGVRLRD